MIGTQLGPYLIIEEIGQGGMATVYRAEQARMGRNVAIKIIHRAIALDHTAVERFQREAKLIARLEHPHILPVYDYNPISDPPYIVMRYLPTGTLKNIMERGPLPHSEVVFLFRQIASALDYAHRQGIVHRDIKPSNIMVDAEGNAFLTDFGIARMVESEGLTASGVAVGTPGYMSPEQGMGTAVDGRSDIYSLGVMLFEMLTGQAPYSAETPMAVLLKHINAPVPSANEISPELPPEIDQIIARAMAKDPAARYETVSDMVRDLAQVIGDSADVTPVSLRQAAQQTIRDIEARRAEATRIAAEAAESSTALRGAETPHGPPTELVDRVNAGRRIPMALIVAAVAVIAVIVAVALIGRNNANQAANATATGLAQTQQAAIAEATDTARLATNEAAETATQAAIIAAQVSNTPTPPPSDTPLPSDTPTATLTVTPSNTPLPTATATFTATPTYTLTLTHTPTATRTPSATNTPTATFTTTATITPTATATDTPQPTATPTASSTPPPTFTPIPSPTPLPPGAMPYLNDFEDTGPLNGWDYNPENWRIVTEGGNQQLEGRSGLDSPIEVLGNDIPDWQTNNGDLVISYRLKLTDASSGARTLFMFSGEGYYALEAFPGLVSLRRGAAGQHVERSPERIIRTFNAPVQQGQWYEFTIWVEGPRIFVYLDRQLIIRADDSAGGSLPPGSVLFQTVSRQQGIDLDDLKIEQPVIASEHFEGADFPLTWTRNNSFNATRQLENGQNQYIRMEGDAEIRPNITTGDMRLSTRVLSVQGGMQLVLRESEAGSVSLRLDGGNLTVMVEGAERQVISQQTVTNFYGRGSWFDLAVEFTGSRLFVYRNGTLYYEESLSDIPSSGELAFISQGVDIFQLDDVLLTEIKRSTTEDARFAFDLLNELAARPIQDLLNDWYEFFDDALRTDWWWEGGQPGPGEYVTDATQPSNQTYYRMTYLGRPTWRLMREALSDDRTIFGQGSDSINYNDSSDFYARVLVRLEGTAAGSAWLGGRSQPTFSGANLDQYRLMVNRGDDGTYTVTVTFSDPTHNEELFNGELPRSDAGTWPEWTELIIVALDDRIAFFANGRLIAVDVDANWLGGTVAIGLEEGTVANFDDLIIRDTSPRPF